MLPTIDSSPAFRARAPLEPIARLHRLLLSLFGSGEHFRRFIALGPCGQELVTELPEHHASTAAALLDGLDLLIRRGHVDAEFFVRLADEFPLRADDIAQAFMSWRPQVTALTRNSPRGRILPGIAVLTASLGIALVCQELAARTTPQALAIAEGPAFEARGDGIIVPARVDPAPRPDRRSPRKVSPARPVAPVSDDPPALPAAACALPPALAEELDALARSHIASPAVAERFTVVLRTHADSADVSPRPLPGQATRRQLHERLTRLGPQALGRCREIAVDVTFSYDGATLTPRLP